MEEKTLRCPNCGANATNHDNCEYCGSLLVRLVDNGIDVDAYLSGHKALPGLSKALKENCQLKKRNPNELIATDIYGKYLATEDYNFVSVISSDGLKYQNGGMVFSNSKGGLGVVFSFIIDNFAIYELDDVREEENKRIKIAHDKFRKLSIFDLFVFNVSKIDNGFAKKSDCYEYAIDFGQDADGAARLISDVLNQVFGVSYNSYLKFVTNVGKNAIEKSREEHNEAFQYGFLFIVLTILSFPILTFIMKILASYYLGKTLELTFLNICVLILMSGCSSLVIITLIEDKEKKKKLKNNNNRQR